MATQQPTAAFGRELCGLHADVPHAGWGGKWASSTEVATGMVVKFNRDVIYIRFLPTAETDDLRVSWAVLFGQEMWNGQRILLHPLTWTSDSLTPQPDQRPPASADCWDMRRAGWVRSDGSSAASVSRAVIQHRWYQNTRGCHGDETSRAWLISGGDIDTWRWTGVASLEIIVPAAWPRPRARTGQVAHPQRRPLHRPARRCAR